MTQEMRKLLGLRLDLRETHVSYGRSPQENDEIDPMTRSILQITLELAAIVEFPGRTWRRTGRRRRRWRAGPPPSAPAIRVSIREQGPSDAQASVRVGERWLRIVGTDQRSKPTFASMTLFCSISDAGVKGSAPVVAAAASP